MGFKDLIRTLFGSREADVVLREDDELSRVPWAELRHAYGEATDVPGQIRALRSPKKKVREKALWHLYGNIFHQGTRYQASAHAVPFLLDLVRDDSVPDRDEIVLLLVHLAMGYPDEFFPEGLDIEVWYREMVSKEGWESEGIARWYVDAHQAVRKGVPLFVDLLDAPQEKLRVAAGYALAWFREDAGRTAPAVRSRLETTGTVSETSNLLLTLGMLDNYRASCEDRDTFAQLMGREHETPVRTCAALASVIAEKDNVREDAMEILFDSLKGPAKPEVLHWNDGDLVGLISMALGVLGPGYKDKVVEELCAVIPTLNAVQMVTVVGVLLQLLFPKGMPESATFDGLDDRQQKLLKALAEHEEGWWLAIGPYANFALLMSAYGLPCGVEKMQAFVRGEDAQQYSGAKGKSTNSESRNGKSRKMR